MVEDRRYATKFVLPALADMLVEDVTSRDVERLHHVQRKTPVQANRLLTFLSSLFARAEKWKLRADGSNPARGIRKFAESTRTRQLSDLELARFGRALRELEAEAQADPVQGAQRTASLRAIRLLLLTGSRKSEILGARWEWIDFEAGELVLPELATKAKREHRKPLAPEALEILRAMGAKENGLLFPQARNPNLPRRTVRRTWVSLLERARLRDLRLHDLRRTVASLAAEGGVPLPHLMALMGWSQLKTAEVYVRRRTEQTHEHLERVTQGLLERLDAPTNVHELPRPAAG